MHRHGTLRGRWKALLFGAVWFVLGWLLVDHFAAGLFSGAAPRAPTTSELSAILFGVALILFGAIMGLTPHVIWLLRTFYKEDFAQGARCPVTLVCLSCGEYNPMGRPSCRSCRVSLAGAPHAGSAAAERARYHQPAAGDDAEGSALRESA